MEKPKNISKKESQESKYDHQNKSNNKIGNTDNKITKIDDRKDSIFLLFYGTSCIDIFDIENNIFVLKNNVLERSILTICRKHNIQCCWQRITNTKFLEIIYNIRNLFL